LKELGMQQRFRKLALFVGAASLTGAGLMVVACGTDNGTATPVPGVDGGNKDTGPGKDGTVDPGQDGSTEDGGADAADCTNNPKLRDFSNNFRCAFLDAGAGTDSGPICQNAQTCCNTSDKVGTVFQPSYCATGVKGTTAPTTCQTGAAAAGSTFNKGNQWECADKNACAAGEVCCVIQDQDRLALDPNNKLNIGNTPKTDLKHPQACGVQRVYNENGSRCRAAAGGNCPAGEIKLCSLSDNNCGAGTTCTPFIDFQNFVDRGFCK
jgi:hypothetical protein